MFCVSIFLSFFLLANSLPTKHLTQELNWDKNLLLDDILFPEGFTINSGRNGERFRWPSKTLIYQVDPTFSNIEAALIQRAMTNISSTTCIKFQVQTTEADYVYIKRGEPNSGCNSYVGRIGGEQILNLQAPHTGPGGRSHCLHVGTIAHELIHALGFYHEQSRTDRDDYVTINWDNITPEYQFAFNKYPALLVSSFDVPYDYASIMHYENDAFAIDYSIPTIYPTQDPNAQLGGQLLTNYDVQKLQKMYTCE